MPSSGSGVGTPIGSGAGPAAVPLVEPFPYTLLSVNRWAKILGIAPLHFAGADTPGLNPMIQPVEASCSSLWWKYDWQMHDQVSRMQVAETIQEAENDIADFLGYWPATKWVLEDQVMYPRPYERDAYSNGLNIRGGYKAVKARYGKVVSVGPRATTLVGTATTAGGSLVYSDNDGDGYYELATITLATALTDASEIKVYFSGYSGQIEWEVRPVKSITISGGNVVIKIDAWLLIDPALYETFPTSDGIDSIDVSTTSNYVTSVDVYREYISASVRASEFVWEPSNVPCSACGGTGCEACATFTQDGCATIRDARMGLITPVPAAYSESDGWTAAAWTGTREPDYVKLWYLAGEQSQEWLRGISRDTLSNEWARLIAYLATARLERPPCACGNLVALHTWLAEDVSMSVSGRSFFVPQSMLDNPFGTRRGEVMAWRRLSKLAKRDRILGVALV